MAGDKRGNIHARPHQSQEAGAGSNQLQVGGDLVVQITPALAIGILRDGVAARNQDELSPRQDLDKQIVDVLVRAGLLEALWHQDFLQEVRALKADWASRTEVSQSDLIELTGLARIAKMTPVVAPVREPGSYITDYVVEEYRAAHIFPNPRAAEYRTTVHTRRIRAVVDGMKEFWFHHSTYWPAGAIPEHELHSDGQLTIRNLARTTVEGVPGVRFDFVVEIEPMKAGETRTLTWVRRQLVSAPTGEVTPQDWVDVFPHVEIETAIISIKFHPTAIPREIWRVENLLADHRFLESSFKNVLTPRKDGFVESAWKQPKAGFSSGICWLW